MPGEPHPYGSWPSPISTELITAKSTELGEPVRHGDRTFWRAALPTRGGLISLMVRDRDGSTTELIGEPYSVRNRVHEYGGGAWTVGGPGAGTLVFTNFADNRLYRLDLSDAGADPVPLTEDDPGLRYGALEFAPEQGAVLAVREDHREPGEPRSTVVLIPVVSVPADGTADVRVLAGGADFYADPTAGPDGAVAWIEWDHPAMPWDATRLMLARLDPDVDPDGPALGPARRLAGGPAESVVHPGWSPTGDLVFLSDRTGWWNFYRIGADRLGGSGDGTPTADPLCPRDAEFCGPAWNLGGRPYAFVDDTTLACRWSEVDGERLGLLDLTDGSLRELATDAVAVGAPSVGGGRLAVALAFATRPRTLVELDLTDLDPDRSELPWTVLARTSESDLPDELVSRAEPVSWEGPAGVVHAWFYPPVNPDVTAPADELPPLITISHGGPTAAASPSFDLRVQYWTSRGFGMLDVDYSGSTGYGRPYRDRLQGNWGLIDVTDCADGAVAMSDQGRADRNRLAIRGGSAGGYTTLRALTSTDVFSAGISLYGIGDLEILARDTHKFESRYLDGLVGAYPEQAEVYRDRSPIHHVDALSSAILLLQGDEDAVVPPNQAELFAAAAREKGLPVAMIMFAGEGHGFRRPENVRASLEAQLYFLGRVFGFTPADPLTPVQIDNLAG